MKKLGFKIINFIILASFIFTSVPVRGYAGWGDTDKLRTEPAVKRDGGKSLKGVLLIENYRKTVKELEPKQVLAGYKNVYERESLPLLNLVNKLTPQNIKKEYLLTIISTAIGIINSNDELYLKKFFADPRAVTHSPEALLIDLSVGVIKETLGLINTLKLGLTQREVAYIEDEINYLDDADSSVKLLSSFKSFNEGQKKLKLADGGKTITIEKDNIFGPELKIDFEIVDGIWNVKELTLNGQVKGSNVRKLSDLKKVVAYPEALNKLLEKGDPVVYTMHRDISVTAEDKEIIRANNLRCDITVIPPGMVGKEIIKTVGHFHPAPGVPGKPGIDNSFTEVYAVLSGEALYYLQKIDKDGNVVDAVWIRAKAGDIVPIPSTYGHITINPSPDKPLVMMNWVYNDFESVYGDIANLKGGAYYFIEENGKIKAVLNPAYKQKRVVPIRAGAVSDALAEAIGLPKGEPVYDVINRPKDLAKLVTFLSQPTPSFTLQFLANDLRRIDTAFYNSTDGREFEDFLDSVKDANLALLFGANAIFENAGTIAALEASAEIRIAVWAKDESEVERLRAMGLENTVDIISTGFESTLQELKDKYGLTPDKIKVIMSEHDDLVRAERHQQTVSRLGINVIVLTQPDTEVAAYAMLLVIARAIKDSLIYDDYVLNKYETLSNSYVERGQISESALKSFNEKTGPLIVAPQITVSNEAAKVQKEYEQLQIQIKETVGEI